MMVEFLPNLDDGELWIPSDILVADVPVPAATKTAFSSPPPPPSRPSFHSPSNIDVDLTRHLAALSLLNHPFQSANQYGLTAMPTRSGPHPIIPPTTVFAFRSGLPYFSPDPVFHYPLLQPGQPRQILFQFQNAVSRPVQPGFVRECGGTGVFLPRAACDGFRRDQGLGNRNMRIMGQNQRNGQRRCPNPTQANLYD